MESSDQRPASEDPAILKSPSDGWKECIIVPTILAGLTGAGAALVSKHRKTHGVANLAATYATNFAIVAGCYCGARELARDARASEQDDLLNSVIGGFCSGAVLGRLQGGQLGAIRYAILFALAGTTLDYATLQLRPILRSYKRSFEEQFEQKDEKSSWWSLPEWSPIKILDEEALAKKRDREHQLYEQRALGKMTKEES